MTSLILIVLKTIDVIPLCLFKEVIFVWLKELMKIRMYVAERYRVPACIRGHAASLSKSDAALITFSESSANRNGNRN